jgi:glycerol kinase
MNTGQQVVESKNGLLATIAAGFDEKINYALEGSVFTGGAVIQWFRDEMSIIDDSADSEYFAGKVEDTAGVYIVPAFTGLGAPYWDMYARGCIIGITRGTNRAHIIRAALESIAYQVMDLLEAMENDSSDGGQKIKELKVDGGASSNKFLLQFQSDICQTSIVCPVIRETTALGAACLAGITVGFWKDIDEVKSRWQQDIVFKPLMESEKRDKLVKNWYKAVERSRNWAES